MYSTLQNINQSKKGLTPVKIISLISVVILIITASFYFATKKSELLSEKALKAPEKMIIREPPAAKIIAEYEKEYDTNEYCDDTEVYDVACEEACDTSRGGRELKPESIFVDCKVPKRCCYYPPQTWPSFDSEPA